MTGLSYERGLDQIETSPPREQPRDYIGVGDMGGNLHAILTKAWLDRVVSMGFSRSGVASILIRIDYFIEWINPHDFRSFPSDFAKDRLGYDNPPPAPRMAR